MVNQDTPHFLQLQPSRLPVRSGSIELMAESEHRATAGGSSRFLPWVVGLLIAAAVLGTGVVLALNARTHDMTKRQREAQTLRLLTEKNAAVANSWQLTVTPAGKPSTTVLIDQRNSDEKMLAEIVAALEPLFSPQAQSGEQFETGIYSAKFDGGNAVQNSPTKDPQFTMTVTT